MAIGALGGCGAGMGRGAFRNGATGCGVGVIEVGGAGGGSGGAGSVGGEK